MFKLERCRKHPSVTNGERIIGGRRIALEFHNIGQNLLQKAAGILLKRQRDAVGLSIFSDKLDVHTPSKSSTVHHKLLYL